MKTRTVHQALIVLLIAGGLAACAPRIAPRTPAGTPLFPDFPFPAVPQDLAGSAAVVNRHNGAWQFLQAGDLRAAERGFAAAVQQAPGFYPSETGLAFVQMAQRQYGTAVVYFDRALHVEPAYVPALLGRGEALLALDRSDDALASFEAALAADGSLAAVRSRVEVLRFRGMQEQVARARSAVQGGRTAEARDAYLRAMGAAPDSGFLYRELAEVEFRQKDFEAAFRYASRAFDLDPQDARAAVIIGDIHEARGEYEAALAALGRARAIDSNEVPETRLERLREHTELARLPAEYQAIASAPAVSRADLAALFGIRLGEFLQGSAQGPPVLMTDTRGHWAASWIQAVARAGVMEVYPNHTFQPAGAVRRVDLAQAASRVLNLIAARDPVLARTWRNPRQKFSDLSPGHLGYPAAALAVQAGIMPMLEGNTFQLSRPVSGAEAVEALARLEAFARYVR